MNKHPPPPPPINVLATALSVIVFELVFAVFSIRAGYRRFTAAYFSPDSRLFCRLLQFSSNARQYLLSGII